VGLGGVLGGRVLVGFGVYRAIGIVSHRSRTPPA